ncbi:hypothetical protein C8N25_102242 [Algoriphagus antarcticus]|uniref:Uncharacterized protein n=1 Tax=Algoriphagus antarcticus TaxID=238540 RepID=A0A3E0E6D5_9BACT|nr:hypothetical protein C8N25_102242 [Algoriphagus antarcticus]
MEASVVIIKLCTYAFLPVSEFSLVNGLEDRSKPEFKVSLDLRSYKFSTGKIPYNHIKLNECSLCCTFRKKAKS